MASRPIQDLCSTGRQQSPINLNSNSTVKCGVKCNLKFYYRNSRATLNNDGRNIIVKYDQGSYVNFNSDTYELDSITFSLPGSHQIDNYSYPIEIQLNHINPINGAILIISIMGELNDALSKSSIFLDQITDKLPVRKNTGSATTINMPEDWNAFNLIPDAKSFMTYSGSLPRSPCTEMVTWIVFDNEVNVSTRFHDSLRGITGNNSRPLQPLNDRKIFYNGNSDIANTTNYGSGIKCYSEAEFKKACSCSTQNVDIINYKNRTYLIGTGAIVVSVFVILGALYFYSKRTT